MAVGKSNRIVVEVEPDFKEQMYAALKARGLTFKEWLTAQATSDLLSGTIKKLKTKAEGGAG